MVVDDGIGANYGLTGEGAGTLTLRPVGLRRQADHPAAALRQRRGRPVGRLVGRRLLARRRRHHPLHRRCRDHAERLDHQQLRHRAAHQQLPAVLPGRVAQQQRLRPRSQVSLRDGLQQRGDQRVGSRPRSVHGSGHAALGPQRRLRLRLHALRLADWSTRPATVPNTRCSWSTATTGRSSGTAMGTPAPTCA